MERHEVFQVRMNAIAFAADKVLHERRAVKIEPCCDNVVTVTWDDDSP